MKSENVGQQFDGMGVDCDNCGEWHPATYSHDSEYGSRPPVYAVVCDKDHLTDYYLDERLKAAPVKTRARRRRR